MIAITAGERQLTRELVRNLIRKGEKMKVLLHSEEECTYFKQKISGESVQFIVGDIQDVSCLEALLDGISTIIHLDEMVSHFAIDKQKMYRHNVEGTANVVNVALYRNVKKVIFLSSIYALGDKSDLDFFDETAKWSDVKNAKGYGWSKHLAEREIWRGVNEGLKAVILNAGSLVSEDSIDEHLSKTMSYLVKKEAYSVGFLNLLNSSDLIEIIESVIGGEFNREQFVVVDNSISYEEVLKKVKGYNRAVSYETLMQRSNARRYAAFFTRNKVPFPSQSYAKLISDKRKFSNKKIKQSLQYEFSDTKPIICKFVEHIIL